MTCSIIRQYQIIEIICKIR